MRVLLALVLLQAVQCAAAVTASGRHWRMVIDSLACEPGPVVVVGARLQYRGPKGPVEAPLARLADDKGTRYPAKSVVWKRGEKAIAAWLVGGGLANLKAEEVGELQFRFPAQGAGGTLDLEFGDIKAFALTRKGTCLKLDELHAPRAVHRKVEAPAYPVYRARYPCSPSRTIAAEYPPYLPRQLLLLGRGYLPNAREIALPMGVAPAQPYAFAGADDLAAVESVARGALAADFPEYPIGGKYFVFNWGAQKAQSGNEAYSVGIYELRPCPK
jgi:hypothetical protein